MILQITVNVSPQHVIEFSLEHAEGDKFLLTWCTFSYKTFRITDEYTHVFSGNLDQTISQVLDGIKTFTITGVIPW